jgi:hypothetical protein
MARIAIRAIFDLQQVAVMLFIALHVHGAQFGGERAGERLQAVLVGEELAVGPSLDQRFDNRPGMTAAFHHLHELLMGDHALQQLLEVRS